MKAFPTAADNGHSGNQDGMDLRDYFAAAALQGGFCLIPHMKLPENKTVPEAIAQMAYEYADAMMKAREAK